MPEKKAKNMNFMNIIAVLRTLLESGQINANEYRRAKKYYKKLTGADIVIAD